MQRSAGGLTNRRNVVLSKHCDALASSITTDGDGNALLRPMNDALALGANDSRLEAYRCHGFLAVFSSMANSINQLHGALFSRSLRLVASCRRRK